MSMVTDENGEGVSYIKMDEYGNVRQEPEKIWWDYLPTCLTDLFLSCGCRRPETGAYVNNNSRMAWSADERNRYFRIQQQGEGALLDNRAMPRGYPRDMMQVEDMDEARLHRQNTYPNVARTEMQQSGPNGEPRRVFVIKDPNGNPQVTDHLKEGETYLVEDIDETPRNVQLHDAQVEVNAGEYRNPGNEENLRLHAGPRDGASLAELMRRTKRAGEEPGGIQQSRGVDEGGGGGTSYRYVDGQSVGVTPRGEFIEDYTNNPVNYIHGAGNNITGQTLADAKRQQAGDTVTPRLRIKTPNEEDMMEDIEDTLRGKGKQGYRNDRPDFPGRNSEMHSYLQKNNNNYGFQHTKASMLRYETNMAKLEEDQQKEAEKDPLYKTMRKNSAIQAEARRAALYAAEDSSLETRRTLSQAALELKQRRETIGSDKLDSLERSGSVPNIQTELEKAAAHRRGSLSADDINEGVMKRTREDGADKDANLSDDAKKTGKTKATGTTTTLPEGELSPDALKALEEQMRKDFEEGDEASKAATDKSRKKRNAMTEKKSIFTIAYDDMQTNQLRPDSAAHDP